MDDHEIRNQFEDLKAREIMLHEFGEMSFAEMVAGFSIFKNVAGADPFDALKIDEWASSGVISHGEKIIAQFILAVFNPDTKWKCGRFDITDVALLDAAHRHIIMKWVASPKFP